MNEHGYCPLCGTDLDGESIWNTFFDLYGDADRADAAASGYGATRTTGKWGRMVGYYDVSLDRVTRYQCPACKEMWDIHSKSEGA